MIIAFATILIIGCKKKNTTTPDETPAPSTTGTPLAAGSFTWTENGGAVITADSAFWTTGTWGTGIRASKGGFTNYFEVNWATQNNTAIGQKALTAGSLTFLKGPATYTNSAAENLSVTGVGSNALSGNFSVSVTGGSINTIVGGFSSMKFK